MYLMYVDESGDIGFENSPTNYYILTGLVVHELRWRKCLNEIIALRRSFRDRFGFKLREEFHTSSLITRPGSLIRIPRHHRLTMIRNYADCIASIRDLSLINIVVDKSKKEPDYPIFENAWKWLIQRFENILRNKNFPGPENPDDRGILFPDHTADKKLTLLLRTMHSYNPVPNNPEIAGGYRNLPINYIIEDPSYRDSIHSYFIQTVDLAAYLLYQYLSPNDYMRITGGKNYFIRLDPVLCKHASRRDRYGIVWM